MNSVDNHREAEQAIALAETVLARSDRTRYTQLYALAAQFEERAYNVTRPEFSVTRGIIAVSAVSCWFKAGESPKARTLARELAADPLLPDVFRAELKEMAL